MQDFQDGNDENGCSSHTLPDEELLEAPTEEMVNEDGNERARKEEGGVNNDMQDDENKVEDFMDSPTIQSKLTKPPQMEQLTNGEGNDKALETIYKIHLQVRKYLPGRQANEINIIEKFKLLFSRMTQQFPNLYLAPFYDEMKDNHVVQGINVSKTEKYLKVYVKGARIMNTNNLFLNFKATSPILFWKLKSYDVFFNFLVKNEIFLSQYMLNTYEMVKVRGGSK